MKRSKIITLTTDFGEADSYVAAMKGVILSIAPDARLVDISHQVQPGDINEAAFIIKAAAPCFPLFSVHLAVVDPGVGTGRRPIAIESRDHVFVGPDNGIFTEFIDENTRAYHLNKNSFFLDRISNTFHGRDIFAPAAAHICLGRSPREMGDMIDDPVMLERPEPQIERGKIKGQVIHIDRFGNLVTNIPEKMLPKKTVIRIAGKEIKGISSSYTGPTKDSPIAIIGSTWLLEISIPNQSAAKKLKAKVGTKVEAKGVRA